MAGIVSIFNPETSGRLQQIMSEFYSYLFLTGKKAWSSCGVGENILCQNELVSNPLPNLPKSMAPNQSGLGASISRDQ